MLFEFRVENFRSIRSEQALSLVAADRIDPESKIPRATKSTDSLVLPAVAIYGKNASGKSNVLSALSFMRDAVILSSDAIPGNETNVTRVIDGLLRAGAEVVHSANLA
jgi:AAA15 family ATPase/GTPase